MEEKDYIGRRTCTVILKSDCCRHSETAYVTHISLFLCQGCANGDSSVARANNMEILPAQVDYSDTRLVPMVTFYERGSDTFAHKSREFIDQLIGYTGYTFQVR